MKKIFLILLLSFIGVVGNAQNKAESETALAKECVVQFFDAISTFDFSKMRALTKDVQFLEYGKIWNLDTLINKIRPDQLKKIKRLNTIEFLKAEVNGNTAWLVYNNTADFEMGDKKAQS